MMMTYKQFRDKLEHPTNTEYSFCTPKGEPYAICDDTTRIIYYKKRDEKRAYELAKQFRYTKGYIPVMIPVNWTEEDRQKAAGERMMRTCQRLMDVIDSHAYFTVKKPGDDERTLYHKENREKARNEAMRITWAIRENWKINRQADKISDLVMRIYTCGWVSPRHTIESYYAANKCPQNEFHLLCSDIVLLYEMDQWNQKLSRKQES